MGNWCSTSRKEPASNVTMVHRDNPKKAMNDKDLTGVMVTSEYNTMVLGASNNGEIPNTSSSGRGSFGKEPKVPTILLLPHQHTLFCERKQRVCTAVGRCQELETLKLAGLDLQSHEWVWFRTSSADIFATTDKRRNATVLSATANKAEYQLSKDDVGQYIGVVYGPPGSSLSHVEEDEQQAVRLSSNTLGPVLPGPPRILSFGVSGDLHVGGFAQAQTQYIGGTEGRSEFWWMRITADGKRSQVTEPKAVPETQSKLFGDPAADPRFYRLTAADLGCTLKAKCRPTRTDGQQGEIFTSKSSDTVLPAAPHS